MTQTTNNPFQKATKKQARARIDINGPAGSGKTWTALTLAELLLEGTGKRTALIDTEHESSAKYADRFDYDMIALTDHHPRKFVELIHAAEAAGYGCIIIDSATAEWAGRNGCLQLKEEAAKKPGTNDWTAWRDVTPMHYEFEDAVLGCKMHVIRTFRAKMAYEQVQDERGKSRINKLGLEPMTKPGSEYLADIVIDMTSDNDAVITKTRCSALTGRVYSKPGKELGDIIRAWLCDGAPAPRPEVTPVQVWTEAVKLLGDEEAKARISNILERLELGKSLRGLTNSQAVEVLAELRKPVWVPAF